MKKMILIIMTLMVVNTSFGQLEKTENKIITENFVKYYNNDDYKALFSMFAEVMKNALPLDKTKEYFSSLKTNAGNIISQEFVKYDKGNTASYKTTFENGIYMLNISVDKGSKIDGILIKSLKKESNVTKNITNKLSENDIITTKQAKIIVNKIKVFPHNTQISIAIIKHGNASFYGVKKNKEAVLSSANHKSIFEIGSISKVFTSTLLANFVIDKKIKLDDTVNAYLKTPFYNDIQIPFINLANHSSGLPRLPTNLNLLTVNPENPYKEYKEKELQEYLSEHLKLSTKGKYQYSNLGAGLIGYTLSKYENDTYENLLQTKIFSTYGMHNSTSDINKTKGHLVRGLSNKGKEVANWEFSVLAGAGGILSTTEDLSKFAIAQFDNSNKELKLTRRESFEVNKNMSIGLGWHILKNQAKNHWYWHNGGTGGYSSSMVIDVKTKNGIVILSNVSAFHPNMKNIDKLCFDLMKTLE